jgi:hypothetical protein
MKRHGHCRFESVPIQRGELQLDPWPTMILTVKFGPGEAQSPGQSEVCHLKRQVVQLFEYVRTVDSGEIRLLVVKYGLPFLMEIQTPNPGADGG